MDINKTLGHYISKNMHQERPESDCPSLATLSKFMDGKLKGRERMQVISHLNSCHDCYQSFSEAAFIQEELETNRDSQITSETGHFQNPIRIIKQLQNISNKYTFSVPAIVVVLLVVIWLSIPFHPPGISSMMTSLTHTSNIHQLNRSSEFPGSYSHTFGFYDGLSLERAAIRLGILLFSLEVTIKAHDKGKSLNQLEPLISLVRSLENSEPIAQRFNKILLRIGQGDFPDSIAENAEQLEALLAKKEVVFYLNFGQWLQAVKLAASQQNADFFDPKVVDFYYDSALKKQMPQGVIDSLRKILLLSQTGFGNKKDFNKIEQTVNEIFRILL